MANRFIEAGIRLFYLTAVAGLLLGCGGPPKSTVLPPAPAEAAAALSPAIFEQIVPGQTVAEFWPDLVGVDTGSYGDLITGATGAGGPGTINPQSFEQLISLLDDLAKNDLTLISNQYGGIVTNSPMSHDRLVVNIDFFQLAAGNTPGVYNLRLPTDVRIVSIITEEQALAVQLFKEQAIAGFSHDLLQALNGRRQILSMASGAEKTQLEMEITQLEIWLAQSEPLALKHNPVEWWNTIGVKNISGVPEFKGITSLDEAIAFSEQRWGTALAAETVLSEAAIVELGPGLHTIDVVNMETGEVTQALITISEEALVEAETLTVSTPIVVSTSRFASIKLFLNYGVHIVFSAWAGVEAADALGVWPARIELKALEPGALEDRCCLHYVSAVPIGGPIEIQAIGWALAQGLRDITGQQVGEKLMTIELIGRDGAVHGNLAVLIGEPFADHDYAQYFALTLKSTDTAGLLQGQMQQVVISELEITNTGEMTQTLNRINSFDQLVTLQELADQNQIFMTLMIDKFGQPQLIAVYRENDPFNIGGKARLVFQPVCIYDPSGAKEPIPVLLDPTTFTNGSFSVPGWVD
ncbi:hypothetical protein KKD62_00905 [Patescibacteria group bacterium]|nr:hypothetical protein [Patescibacteria group bacterium]MBU1931733.1 hypothetical protein [Patescibacteria group bacterium]